MADTDVHAPTRGGQASGAASPSAVGLPLPEVSADPGGQATVTVPIRVPPGVGGQAPRLAFSYASRSGNGLMGVGWSCQGFSVITRCRPTYASDGFSAPVSYGVTDRYALDGQRLVVTSGSYGAAGAVYQTEVQSWNLVREKDGGFLVTARNGDTLEYGTTPDSRILAAGRSDVRLWALHAAADKHGNRVEYSYTAPAGAEAPNAGSYYPDEIRYTVRDGRAGARSVKFFYDERPDPIVSYVAGAPVIETRRLSRVTTSLDTASGTEAVLSYAVLYETSQATALSRVVSIVESAGAADAAAGFAVAKVLWSDTPAPGLGAPSAASALDQPGADNIVPMDVTGDGRSDVVHLWLDADGALTATSYLASVDASGVSFAKGPASTLDVFPGDHRIFPADVDGDGRTDLVIAFQDGDGALNLSVFLSCGDGGFAPAPGSPYGTGDPWDPEDPLPFFAMDANGDGRTDIVKACAAPDGTLAFRSYLSRFDGTAYGFTDAVASATGDPARPPGLLAFWAMDVDGDGMMDLVRVWSGTDGAVNATSYVSTCPVTAGPAGAAAARDAVSFAERVNTVLSDFGPSSFMPVDVNGDGVQDLLQIWQDASSGALHLTTYLCDAAGGFVPGPQSDFPDTPMPDPGHLYPMGLNGGGQVSLVTFWAGTDGDLNATVFQGAPSGAFRLLEGGPAISVDPNSLFLPCDPDGNGKADLVQVFLGPDGVPRLAPMLSVGPANDLAATVTNALGGAVELAYAPLTDAGVYDARPAPAYPAVPGRRYPHPLTPTQFPAQAVTGQAIYVLQELRRRPAAEAAPFAYDVRTAMRYAGAQIDLAGRGWQGFATSAATDLGTGRVETHVFNLTFPFTGTVAETRVEADGRYAADLRVPKGRTVLMGRASTAFTAVPATGSVPVQVLATEKRAADFDYGEDRSDRERAETFAYDAYGNATSHVGLGYVKPGTLEPLAPDEVVYRYASFRNDVSADGGWALGFPLYAKTSANSVDPDITAFLPGDLKLERRGYADGTYDLVASAAWDDVHGAFLSTAYDYDASGNRTSETRPGGSVTSYGYDERFGTFRTRTTSPPNARGAALVSESGFDPRFGTEVARRGPDGAISVKALDGFGRIVAEQGPLPGPASPSDPNRVTPLVATSAGLAAAFRAAVVLTLESRSYGFDADGLHRTEAMVLQSFPDGAARDTAWHRSFVDGSGAERALLAQSGQTAGDVLTLTDRDGAGRPTRQGLPFFAAAVAGSRAPHAVVTAYDVLGRPVSRTTPTGAAGDGTAETTWYYAAGGRVTETEAAGTAEAYAQTREHHAYDGHEKVRRTVSGSGGAVATFAYDRLGRLLASIDPATPSNPGGVTNTVAYDALDRRRFVDDPDRNTTGRADVRALSFAYDAATGRLQSETDAAGTTTTYGYDALGRVTDKRFSDGSAVRLSYDDPETPFGAGRLSSAERRGADGGTLTRQAHGYDPYGNPASAELTVDGEAAPFRTATVFDPLKRPVRQTHPDGSVASRRYSHGHLVGTALSGLPDGAANANAAFPLDHYTAAGRPGRAVYGEGAVSGGCAEAVYRYGPTGQLYGETLTGSAGIILDETLAYDALGQLLSATPGSGTEGARTYAYADRRLVSAAVPGFEPAAYGYDAAGDLSVKDGVDYAFRAHFAHSGTRGGAVVYSAEADACGRTVARTAGGVTQHFAYDALGQLASVASAAGAVLSAILNDADGRRVRQADADGTVTVYVGNAYQVSRTATGTVTVTRHLAGAAGPAATVMTGGAGAGGRYLRSDHKGNVTHVLDAAGALLTLVSYGGYGERALLRGTEAPSRSYENKTWVAAAGLYCFEARYYDPTSGRFLTPDSRLAGEDMFQPGVFNRYAFELGNPIGYTDPSGHLPSWAWGLIIGAVILVAAVAVIATGGALAAAVAPGLVAAGVGATAASVAGGAATIAVGAVSGALLGAGVSATAYSLTHTNSSFSWKDFGVQMGVSAAVGFVTGAALSGASVGISAGLTSNLATGALSATTRAALSFGANTLAGAGISSAGDVVGQLIDNKIEGNDLSSGLAASALFGGLLGGLGGAIGSGVELRSQFRSGEGIFSRAAGARVFNEDFGTEMTMIRSTYGTFDEPAQPPASGKFRSVWSHFRGNGLAGVAKAIGSNAPAPLLSISTMLPEAFLEDQSYFW